jgi:ankyrin repeat protein
MTQNTHTLTEKQWAFLQDHGWKGGRERHATDGAGHTVLIHLLRVGQPRNRGRRSSFSHRTVQRQVVALACDLIEDGADPNACDLAGMNALGLAGLPDNGALVSRLLEAGVDLNTRGGISGQTMAMACLEQYDLNTNRAFHNPIVYLIGFGLWRLSHRDETPSPPQALTMALALQLVRTGADPSATDLSGRTMGEIMYPPLEPHVLGEMVVLQDAARLGAALPASPPVAARAKRL